MAYHTLKKELNHINMWSTNILGTENVKWKGPEEEMFHFRTGKSLDGGGSPLAGDKEVRGRQRHTRVLQGLGFIPWSW